MPLENLSEVYQKLGKNQEAQEAAERARQVSANP
jgi:hypothetical protein